MWNVWIRRGAYRDLVGTYEKGSPGHKWEDNIKVDFKEIG